MRSPAWLDALQESAEAGERLPAWRPAGEAVAWLSNIRNELTPSLVKSAVRAAANRRWFDMAEMIAAAAADRFDSTPGMRRLHAQMLLERGFSEEALSRLHALLRRSDLPLEEQREAEGHIGRIYKDRFLAAVARREEQEALRCLDESLKAYLLAYRVDPQAVWHGINAVALLSRAEATHLQGDASATAAAVARAILADAPRNPDEYTAATMAEAYIALRDYQSAIPLIRTYVADARVTAFQLGALHRQLTRVWLLDREPSPGPEIVAMVGAALLQRENGAFLLSGSDVKRDAQAAPASYEQVFGADRFQSYRNYRMGLDCAACVARIGLSASVGTGTGFVVRGSSVCSRWPDAAVLVTNSHVVSEDEELRRTGAIHPAEAVVTFEARPGLAADVTFAPGAVLYTSPPEELDVTILELPGFPALGDSYTIAPVLPARGSQSQVRVIGHPAGRSLSFSANALLDHEAPKLHYRTATEGGSSGSPVFNPEWKLIGLHHAGGDAVPKLNGHPGTYQANEGIWIKAICAAAGRT
jgi:tetratricopeptide (TPR) repeat protein